MKPDKTTLLAALAAVVVLVVVFSPRESFEPAGLAEQPAGDSRSATGVTVRPGDQTSTGALTEPERTLLAELRENFGPEELERVFNRPTFEERQQATSGAVDYLAMASGQYDRRAEFVDKAPGMG